MISCKHFASVSVMCQHSMSTMFISCGNISLKGKGSNYSALPTCYVRFILVCTSAHVGIFCDVLLKFRKYKNSPFEKSKVCFSKYIVFLFFLFDSCTCY